MKLSSMNTAPIDRFDDNSKSLKYKKKVSLWHLSAMETNRSDTFTFYQRFGWVRCSTCALQVSDDHRTYVLTCRHLFCQNCFPKGQSNTTDSWNIHFIFHKFIFRISACKLSKTNQTIAACGECKKIAKYALFSQNVRHSLFKWN